MESIVRNTLKISPPILPGRLVVRPLNYVNGTVMYGCCLYAGVNSPKDWTAILPKEIKALLCIRPNLYLTVKVLITKNRTQEN
jgi:hypothetical protein